MSFYVFVGSSFWLSVDVMDWIFVGCNTWRLMRYPRSKYILPPAPEKKKKHISIGLLMSFIFKVAHSCKANLCIAPNESHISSFSVPPQGLTVKTNTAPSIITLQDVCHDALPCHTNITAHNILWFISLNVFFLSFFFLISILLHIAQLKFGLACVAHHF